MFSKDILMYDIEATGLDVTKHEIIQLAAILLDKKTLKPKKTFNMFVKPKHWKTREPEAMAVNGISWEQLKDAPDIATVLKKFSRTFGADLVPAMYGGNLDIVFLTTAFRKSKMKYPFNYNTFNIWVLCYTYMAFKKQLTNPEKFVGFTLEDVGDYLNVKRIPGRHDALVDCEYQSAILRGLVKALKQ